MLDDAIAVQTARYYRVLRTRGVTVRRTIDMIIGTFCIAGRHALLHDDRDSSGRPHIWVCRWCRSDAY